MRRGGRAWLVAAALALCPGCAPPALEGEPVWIPIEALDGALAAEVGAPPEEAEPLPRAAALEPLRLVTFNLEKAPDVAALATAMAEQPSLARAAVFVVQEIESHPGEGSSQAARLATALALHHVYVPNFETDDGGSHGLAILSALPIADVNVMRLPRADVPYSGAPRIAIRADLELDGQVIRLVNLHLDTTMNVGERLVHLRPAVIDHPDPVIVAGDFNTMPFAWGGDVVPAVPASSAVDTDQAPVIDEFMAALGFDAPTAALGATQQKYGVESRLDSIYLRGVGSAGGAVEREVELSDHYPLWLDVAR